MLPKTHRPTTKSVHYLLRRGKRRHGNLLTITRVGGQRSTRRGVHIAKKIAKNATQRNTAKRAVYTAIEHTNSGNARGGLFFVTVNKKYADHREQLVATSGDIPIYNRVLDAVRDDIDRFVSRYRRQA